MELTIISKKTYLCWQVFFRLLSKTAMFCPELKAATKLLPLPTPAEVRAFPCPAPTPPTPMRDCQSPGTAWDSTGEEWRELEVALEDFKVNKEK